MHKKIVRIISNEDLYKINPFYRSCEYHHMQGIRSFLYHNDINIGDQLYDTIYASKLLASQGFLVMLTSSYNDIENTEIFIPEIISEKQIEYFLKKEVIEDLEKHKIVLYKYNSENDNLKIINNQNNNETMVELLLNELSTNLACKKNSKKKVLKYKQKN